MFNKDSIDADYLSLSSRLVTGSSSISFDTIYFALRKRDTGETTECIPWAARLAELVRLALNL